MSHHLFVPTRCIIYILRLITKKFYLSKFSKYCPLGSIHFYMRLNYLPKQFSIPRQLGMEKESPVDENRCPCNLYLFSNKKKSLGA